MNDKTLDEKFFEYHTANPLVLELFEQFTRRVKKAGHDHYSIDAIMHQVRWHIDIETQSADGFKLNNNYTSRYARLLTKENPDLCGFFRNRKLKTISELDV